MRRLTPLVFVLVAACWSEADFRAQCEAAGNCIAPEDAGGVPDAGASSDAGVMDAGSMDAGAMDAGVMDAGVMDAGVMDAGVMDAGSLPDGGVTWAAVAAELFNTTNTNSGISVLAFPVPTPTRSLGGVLTRAGTVICIPANGHVLEVFPDGGTRSISLLDDAGTDDLWQGGVLLPDGTVFGFPHSVRPNYPVGITPTSIAPFAQELPGFAPVTEGGIVTTNGDVIVMPFNVPAFSVWSSGTLSAVPVDAGVGPSSNAFFSAAVLRASGTSALAVPRSATAVWEVTATTATPLAPLSGYAGGLLLQNGDAVLMPLDGAARAARVDTANAVTPVGPTTSGYFSAAWSTNGFGYAIRTLAASGSYLAISKTGTVTESALPSNASLPDGGFISTGLVLSATSRFGLVAFPDGRLVSCPYADTRLVFIVPNGRRTVPAWVVLSPWLNKW